MKVDAGVALITGVASGLGLATACRLLASGAAVVLADLPSSDDKAIAEELGERARFSAAAVCSEADVSLALDDAQELGDLRVAVSCAGIGTPAQVLGRNGPMRSTSSRGS